MTIALSAPLADAPPKGSAGFGPSGSAAGANVLSKLQGSPAATLAAAGFGCQLGLGCVVLFGPAMPLVRKDLGLGPVEASLLIAAPAFSGSLLRLLAGPLADSAGGDARRLLCALLGLATLGVLGVAMITQHLEEHHLHHRLHGSRNSGHAAEAEPAVSMDNMEFFGLLVLGVLAGCGMAGFSVGSTQVSYWYSLRWQGWALGLFAALAQLGPAMASHLLPLFFGKIGLAPTYYIWCGAICAGTLVYYALSRNAWFFQLRDAGCSVDEARSLASSEGQELFPDTEGGIFRGLWVAAGLWKAWALVSLYFFGFGSGYVALSGWFPTYWHELHGLDVETAGTLTAVFSLTMSFARGASGKFSDLVGGEAAALGGLAISGLGALLLTVATSFYVCLTGQSLLGIGNGIIGAAVFKLIPQEVPQAVGGAVGLVAGLGCSGGFFVPPLLACFVNAMGMEGYARGFSIHVVLMLINCGVAGLLIHSRKRSEHGWSHFDEKEKSEGDSDSDQEDDPSTSSTACE